MRSKLVVQRSKSINVILQRQSVFGGSGLYYSWIHFKMSRSHLIYSCDPPLGFFSSPESAYSVKFWQKTFIHEWHQLGLPCSLITKCFMFQVLLCLDLSIGILHNIITSGISCIRFGRQHSSSQMMFHLLCSTTKHADSLTDGCQARNRWKSHEMWFKWRGLGLWANERRENTSSNKWMKIRLVADLVQ